MITEDPPAGLPPDAKVCNCAGCGVLLLGMSMMPWLNESMDSGSQTALPRIVSEVVGGRPYCSGCLWPRPKLKTGTPSRLEDDGGPWQQNAVRAMEGE